MQFKTDAAATSLAEQSARYPPYALNPLGNIFRLAFSLVFGKIHGLELLC